MPLGFPVSTHRLEGDPGLSAASIRMPKEARRLRLETLEEASCFSLGSRSMRAAGTMPHGPGRH